MTVPQADLSGWSASPFTGAGLTHDVYLRGAGPGVILIPEMPGAHPGVLALGNHLVDSGFTVAIPSLFGVAGTAPSLPAAVLTVARGCVTREFAAFATDADRPVAHYLRALARDLNAQTPGRGVGVIGMCFTGGFALAAATEGAVLAPVLSQPSLPLALNGARKRDPGLSDAELAAVRQRAANDGLCVLGLRFSGDPMSPRERFTTLRDRLGAAFTVIELDSTPGNPHGFGRTAHSVLTLELRETPGHPTYEARRQVVDFLTAQLT